MIGSGLSPAAIAGSKYPELASSGVTFNDFITEMAPGILMTIVLTFMLIKYLYRDEFSGERHRDIAELEAKYGVKDAKLLKSSGFILGLVILGFFLHPIINVAVSWVALAGAVLMLLATNRHDIEEPLEKVEWTTLLFFAGLFVLVHSLQYLGVISYIGNYIEIAIQFFPVGEGGLIRLSAAILIILWVSAFASAFIDNIPYTVTMIPIVLQISSSLSIELGPLIWALAFGACLGGNGTLIGASANVVTAGMAEEAGYPISFKEFFRAGFPVMILTTAIVSVYMIAVYVFSADHTLYAKIVLLGITLVGIMLQVSRGVSKGKSFSESLIDNDYDEIKEVVLDTIDGVKSAILSKVSEEE